MSLESVLMGMSQDSTRSFSISTTSETSKKRRSKNYSSSKPVSLLDLLKTLQQPIPQNIRPCLKNQSKDPKAPFITKNKKSVKFATHAQSNKVWALVKQVEKDSYYQGVDGKALLWWPPQQGAEETQNDLLQPDIEERYAEILRIAFESAKACSNAKIEKALDRVDLNLESFSLCSEARGLETQVYPILIDYKIRHIRAVLKAQELIREDDGDDEDDSNNADDDQKENNVINDRRRRNRRRSSSRRRIYAMDELDLELLRQKSREYSRPSRLMATKLAQLDSLVVTPGTGLPKSSQKSAGDRYKKRRNNDRAIKN